MALAPADFAGRLEALTEGFRVERWLVAYSGGMDSTVLLHLMAGSSTGRPVIAVHVDHGLHPQSRAWAEGCEAFATSLGVGYRRLEVSVNDGAVNGLEAAAREARYQALLGLVRDGDCVLSGHHENDQAETLLLNLMRGSGPAGLAGIGRRQAFGRGLLLRPLLGAPVAEIRDYAARHHLSWVDDPSNVDTRFDRNFLRAEILPAIESRWPAAASRLRRSAELMSEASDLLEQLADIDIAACGTPARLSIAELERLSGPRKRNALRRAIRLCGLPAPPATGLVRIVEELIPARADAQPLVEWPGGETRRYRDELFVLASTGLPAVEPDEQLYPGRGPVWLGAGMGYLEIGEPGQAPGIDPDVAGRGLAIRYRSGGESIRISPGGGRRKLKNLMQEKGILPWMRDRVPLLFAGDELVAVADLWVSSDHRAAAGGAVTWTGKPAIL